MPPEQIFAIIAIIAGPLSGIIIGIIGSRANRHTGDGANSIAAFEANIKAFDIRATSAENNAKVALERADKAEVERADALSRIEVLEQKFGGMEKDYNRMRTVVQKWFQSLLKAWDSPKPMPLPSQLDLDWLGIEHTQPKTSVTATKTVTTTESRSATQEV